MPSLQTQYKLAELFKAIAEGEKQVEIVRQVLAEKSAFEPYAAFKRVDRSSDNYISSYDVLNFLRENDIAVLEKEVSNLIKEHSAKGEDRLSYTEFLTILLPRTSPTLRKLCTQRETYPVGRDEFLEYEVEWALSRVFERELELIKTTEALKRDLAGRHDFDPLTLFKTIDIDMVGAIDFDLIYLFFKSVGIPTNEAEILALIRRIDKDIDGKVTYSEFHSAITSLSSYTRGYDSPIRQSASRYSNVHTPNRQKRDEEMTRSNYFRNSASKLTNYDYIEYLHTSAQKSARSRSPRSPDLSRSARSSRSIRNTGNRSGAFEEEIPYQSSPVRDSLTKKIQERERGLSIGDLSTTIRSSRYRTPTKHIASPERSPVRESLYKSRSPSRSLLRDNISPMKGDEEQELACALREQIDLDQDLENVKTDLALRKDFNLLDAFRFFDIGEKGSISKQELKEGLNALGIFPTNDELYLIMRRFDTDSDAVLRFSEFTRIFAPKKTDYAEILSNREPCYEVDVPLDEIFSEQTLFLLKKTLSMVIKNEASSEIIRQRLNRRPLFDLWEGFKALDKDDKGFASLNEFKDMLTRHGFFPTKQEVTSLVERFDRNRDGKVSYSDFIQEITPKSPQKY